MKTKKRTFFEIVKKFFEPALNDKVVTIKAIIPSIFWSLVGIIAIYLLKDITNKVSDWLNQESIFLLWVFVWLVIINYLIMIFTRKWTYAIFRPVYRRYLYRKYIDDYIFLDNNEAEKVWTGKLIAMIDKWMSSWVDLLSKFILEVLSNVTFVFFWFTFIWLINFYYLLVIIVFFVWIFLMTYFVQKKSKILREKRRDSNIWITKIFVKVLMSKFEILQNWRATDEFNAISRALDDNIKYNYSLRNYWIFSEVSSKLLIDWWKIGLVLMFGMWLWNNLIDFWEFLALMSILYVFDQMLEKSISLYVEFTKIFVEVEKLWNFFDTTPSIKWYSQWEEFVYKKWEIQIKNMFFWYKKNSYVFEDFSINLEGWKVSAFVWNSWSWKSTLVKLISWYIKPNSWEIIVDKQNLSNVCLKSYYKNIGYLTQEPSIFDWTVINNLTYWIDRELKEWELDNILSLAKCEFVYDLEKWLKTQIWERWVRLSWWQKQRLAIAKIFLKNPSIIILDEPTSALDSFSEELITKAMHNLFKWRTVIIIAHRLQTVKHADDIIFLSDWKILERWTHFQLVKLKWQYAKMLELQSWF